MPSVRDLLVERLDALLHDLDDFLLLAGKKFLSEVFQQKLQERTDVAEQKAENK